MDEKGEGRTPPQYGTLEEHKRGPAGSGSVISLFYLNQSHPKLCTLVDLLGEGGGGVGGVVFSE